MTQFEQLLIETIRGYRQRASNANIRNLSIDINTEGRTDGDLKITYRVGIRYDQSVEGNTLEDVFKELLRRKGWTEMHQPLCLPNVEDGDLHGDYVQNED